MGCLCCKAVVSQPASNRESVRARMNFIIHLETGLLDYTLVTSFEAEVPDRNIVLCITN